MIVLFLLLRGGQADSDRCRQAFGTSARGIQGQGRRSQSQGAKEVQQKAESLFDGRIKQGLCHLSSIVFYDLKIVVHVSFSILQDKASPMEGCLYADLRAVKLTAH